MIRFSSRFRTSLEIPYSNRTVEHEGSLAFLYGYSEQRGRVCARVCSTRMCGFVGECA